MLGEREVCEVGIPMSAKSQRASAVDADASFQPPVRGHSGSCARGGAVRGALTS